MSLLRYEDLREWIDHAREIGELVVIEGADTKYEMGIISQLTARNGGSAVLHQKIKGYPPNFRVMTNTLSNIKTVNLTFSLPLESTVRDAIEALSKKASEWEAAAEKFPPKVVESAPILENVVEGDNIDLNIFPVPIWHEMDGGPYIGTANAVITRDPDTGVVNMGSYRCQLHDSQTVGVKITQGKHGLIHEKKYFAKGEPCPMAIVFSSDPLLFRIASSRIPLSISELNYTGAVRGRSVPVIKGRLTGLPIPANAEIAIEGFVNPHDTRMEGPFGEWTGYYAGGTRPFPFLKAATLYYRNDPILCGAPPAKHIYSDYVFSYSIWRSALLYSEIVRAGVPGVKGVYCHPIGGALAFNIVSIEQMYDGHATQAGIVATQTATGAFAGRYTIVVDDDIDPYDLEDVMWAICTRSRPVDTDIIKKTWSTAQDPTVRKGSEAHTTSRAIIYAVKPYEWRHEFPPVNASSKESRKQAFDKWKGMFRGRWQTI